MATNVRDQKTDSKQQDQPSSEVVQTVEKDVKPFRALLKKFNHDWSLTLSAALAYNLLLATFPIVVALLAILGLLLGVLGQDATAFVRDALTHALPKEIPAAAIVRGAQQNLARSSGLLTLLAVFFALVGGSRLFILLETCFCIIYHVRPRPIIRQNLMALGMLLVFIILVPIMALASSIPTLAFSILQSAVRGDSPLLANAAGLLGGLIASFILFEFIYVVVPNQHIRLRHGLLGAVVAAVALQIYVLLFPLYASHFLTGVAGTVGFTAILIVFFYYFAVILLLGAEINAFFVEGVRPIPNDLATFVSTMAGKLNEDIPKDEAETHVDTRPTEAADKEHTVDYVTKTPEPDVPKRVASDPEVQAQALKEQRQPSENVSAHNANVKASPSGQNVEQSHTSKQVQTSSQMPSQRGALVGAIFGAVLMLLIDILRLRRK